MNEWNECPFSGEVAIDLSCLLVLITSCGDYWEGVRTGLQKPSVCDFGWRQGSGNDLSIRQNKTGVRHRLRTHWRHVFMYCHIICYTLVSRLSQSVHRVCSLCSLSYRCYHCITFRLSFNLSLILSLFRLEY